MFAIFLASVILGSVYCQQTQQEVAFSAGVTHNEHIHDASVVAYDKVYTNIGAGYNSATGKFICPTPGVYIFQFHTLSRQDKAVWLELYHNAYYIASVYGHETNDYASGGNSVILTLSKGDEVYIKSVDSTFGSDTDLYGLPDEIYSTFSGYMVSPIFEEIPAIGK